MKFYSILFLLLFFPVSIFSEKVKIGIYIVNFGKFEVATGSFIVDFYLTLKTDSKPIYPLESFEFMNGRATHIEKIYSEPNLLQYRILANLTSPIDLRRFPFDSQTLSISIENKKYTKDKVEYEIIKEDTNIDEKISFTGWILKEWKISERDHYYNVFKENYSYVSMDIKIEKFYWNSFFKTFLPVLIIMFLISCSFVMDVDKVKDRLGICTSGLVASVMFHLSISNQIPPVTYLTIADKFMLLSYTLLMLCVVLNLYILQLTQVSKDEKATRVHLNTKYIIFLILTFAYTSFFAFQI